MSLSLFDLAPEAAATEEPLPLPEVDTDEDLYVVEVLSSCDRRDTGRGWVEVGRFIELEDAQAWCRRVGIRYYHTRIHPDDEQHQRIQPVEPPHWLSPSVKPKGKPLDVARPPAEAPSWRVSDSSIAGSPLPPDIYPRSYIACPARWGGTRDKIAAENLADAWRIAWEQAASTGEAWRVYCTARSLVDGDDGGISYSPEGYPVEPAAARAALRARTSSAPLLARAGAAA
jgi:hypothetical protein